MDTLRVQEPEQQPTVVVTDPSKLLRHDDSPIVAVQHKLEQLRRNFVVLLSPGDKQFKDLPKRVRLMLVSFLLPVLFAVTKLFILPEARLSVWILIAIVLGIICYFAVYWGVNRQVRKESYMSILPLPALFTVANTMFLAVTFAGPINRLYLLILFLLATMMFMILLYILSLAINVLNVNLFYTIPLSKLGESVAYMAAVVQVFLITYAAVVVLMPLIATGQYVIVAGLIGILGFFLLLLSLAIAFYFLPYQRNVLLISIVLAGVLTITAGVCSVFLAYAWEGAIIASMMSYILYGYIIHKEQNTLKNGIILEFIAISFVIIVLLFYP